MIAWIAEIVSWTLLLAGAAFTIIGMIGLNRMPDFYTRMHAASVTDTLGAGLILFGLMIQAGLTLVSVKLGFLVLLLAFTGPVATHALARAAFHRGAKPLLAESEGDEPSKR